MQISIRPIQPNDLPAVQALAVAAGMFGPDEAGFLAEQYAAAARGEVPGATWLMAVDDDGAPIAAAQFAREPFADRMWNLYFLVVAPHAHGRGLGRRLVDHVETTLRGLGEAEARTLILETSSTADYAAARAFYAKVGFVQEATVREFYGPGDHKVVFWKALHG